VSQEGAVVEGRKMSPGDVADVLRSRINSGRLRPGTRMPTQARLADEFGVERGTVRQALRILQDEQLLTNVTKGSPATVAAPGLHARALVERAPQPTMVALSSRIASAFSAPHVTIDALCLTAVSFTMALSEPLRLIHEGRIAPAKVAVRVLLPARNITLAFPVPVGDTGDHRPHSQWLAQRNAQGQVLRHNLHALRASHGIDVSVEFRALPFTPPVKLYLLNGLEALFAYYTISKQETEIDHERLETYEVQGTQSMLFPFAAGASARDAAFVEQSRNWFDALWNTITSDLKLAP
jgi:DNA-binding transcriptional regulator YhcF (GntR family)